MKESYKYVNYFNDEFILNEQKTLENRYLTLPKWIYIKCFEPQNDKNIHSMYLVLNFVVKDKNYNVAYYEIISSGLKNDDNKRIIIPKKIFSKSNLIKNNFFNNLMVIAVYNAGNKNCYIRFGTSLNPFINEDDLSLDKRSTIKLDFSQIVYCLKSKEKIKYYQTYFKVNYAIYLSTKFEDLLQINENDFKKVEEKEIEKIKNEIKDFREKNFLDSFSKENFKSVIDSDVLNKKISNFSTNTSYLKDNKLVSNNSRKFSFDFVDETLKINKNQEKIKDDIDDCEKRKSNNQSKFRNNLLLLYESKCILTDINVEPALIASHIKPWRDFKDYDFANKYNINNGLLLVASVDKLFDGFLISFDEKGRLYIPDYCKKFLYTKENIVNFLKKSGVKEHYLDGSKSIFEKINQQFQKFYSYGWITGKQVLNFNKIKERLKEHFIRTKHLTEN